MSEMFTKCNGFIVSGDPLVYADSATMTGQGTVSEPFGVKSTDLFVQEPLYTGTSGNSAYIGCNINETLLYSGEYNQSLYHISFSQPLSSFERIKVCWQHQTACKQWTEYKNDSLQWYTTLGRYATNDQFINFTAVWQPTENKMSADYLKGMYASVTTAKAWAVQNVNINEVVPIEVIGINRKA